MKIYKNGMQLIYSETWKKQTKKISVVLTDSFNRTWTKNVS